ncbi:hypothetical protein [Cryobacterium sp. PAMC25264]|uniref:hypothetical protein n=1 Tax=Cryobacterium sp. PAMC25264 TaxID=2861288 RepID=UPI00210611D0|nr:hypothetical protein [Cryobacterium sp. PAMC25264]
MSFGTVITPSGADPAGTVALAVAVALALALAVALAVAVALALAVAVAFAVAVAVATERAGRALVTSQGHPYRPRFLDA